MNWWQILIVGNLTLIAAVFLIAWFATLAMCGTPWQRVAGFVGLLLLVAINLCAFLSVDAKRSRRAELPAHGALASSVSPVNAAGTPVSSEPNEQKGVQE